MHTEFRVRTIAVLFALLVSIWLAAFKAQATAMDVTSIDFEATVLQDLGIRISYEATIEPLLAGQAGFEIAPSADLSFDAPGGNFEGFSHGVLRHRGGLTLQFSGSTFTLSNFELRVVEKPLDLEFFDESGRRWFLFENSQPEIKDGYLYLRNMDVSIAPELAALLGRPSLAGSYIGQAELRIPDRSEAAAPGVGRGSEACVAVFNADRDVTLVNLGIVSQVAREAGGRVATSFSALLRNTGTSSILWKRSIDPDGSAANVGEHPYLALHMYRLLNGRMTQIGRAGVKHAFFSGNTNCSCAGAQVIYPTCEDEYGSSTNSNQLYLAPREEVSVGTGAWSRVGSHFDGSPIDGYRDHGGSSAHDSFEHRLIVAESDLQTGGSYFAGAWYIVSADVDLFNSMGRDPVSPSFAGSTWTFAAAGSLVSGSILDEFVDPVSPPAGSANAVLDTGQGRLQLAMATTNAGGGLSHYEYALMNFDFDRQVNFFSLPLPPGVSTSNIDFSDGDSDAGNDWSAVVGLYDITWSAPAGNELDWGTLYNFAFDADVAAVATKISLGVLEPGTPATVSFDALGPAAADNDRDGVSDSTDVDDDNDGLSDEVENGNVLLDPYDADSDDDGIIDGLDRSPGDDNNVFTSCVSPDATLLQSISAPPMTCAATNSISTISPAGVTSSGDLLMISPTVELGPEFYIQPGGKIAVISADPTAEIPNPPLP